MEAGYCRGPGPSRAVAPQMMMMMMMMMMILQNRTHYSRVRKNKYSSIIFSIKSLFFTSFPEINSSL
jgi:hypothetical protein